MSDRVGRSLCYFLAMYLSYCTLARDESVHPVASSARIVSRVTTHSHERSDLFLTKLLNDDEGK